MIIVLGDGVKTEVVPVQGDVFKDACQQMLRRAADGYQWGHLMERGTGRIAATLAKTVDGGFRVVQSGLLAWRLDVPGAVVVRPLPPGTVVQSWGAKAVVVEDHANDSLVVDVEGRRQPWSWEYDREPTQVLSLPAV